MIVGVGIDVVDVARFTAKIEASTALRDRLFVDSERVLPPNSMAGRFAAKEALVKALGGPGGLHWHDAEVLNHPDGRPYFELTGSVLSRANDLDVQNFHLSISHDGGIASAIVIAES